MKGRKSGNTRTPRATGGGVLPFMDEGKGTMVKAAAKARSSGGAKVSGADRPLRMDRPGRKFGGRVGADRSPLSTAATTISTGNVTDPNAP